MIILDEAGRSGEDANVGRCSVGEPRRADPTAALIGMMCTVPMVLGGDACSSARLCCVDKSIPCCQLDPVLPSPRLRQGVHGFTAWTAGASQSEHIGAEPIGNCA